jgi:hypothetical protein
MIRIQKVLERALQDSRITRQDWESLMAVATVTDEAVLRGENELLCRLVGLLEGGEVGVEGLSHKEVLERLSVFI